jgi:hypothetical protein
MLRKTGSAGQHRVIGIGRPARKTALSPFVSFACPSRYGRLDFPMNRQTLDPVECWMAERGQTHRFSLMLRKPEEFLKALDMQTQAVSE